MKLYRISTLVAAIATGQAAIAATPTGNRDVHCLMLSNLFAQQAPAAQAKEAAAQSRLFYLGRVSGKLGPAQLAPALTSEAKTINFDRAGQEMNACLGTVQAAAAAVEGAGKKAQAATGTAGPPAPKP